MLEIRLVGTVEALLDGQPVELPGRRVRALLAVLALTPGETVSVESLGTAIWGDDPPERVRGSLQTYVARMRRVLGDERVATRRDGYALLVPRDAVDLLALWDGAQGARREADPADECAALAAVLARWHDEPFGEAPSEWLDRNERPQWEERRLQVFERWVDLSFEAGNHRSCLEELNREVERHPLREPLWVRLLGALDRMGRTAEALERYEGVRKRLAEELGVDPSPDLRGVYATLLERADEHANLDEQRAPAVVPHQLPARIRGFVGRDDQLSDMDRVLTRSSGQPDGAVLALHGPAGAGKTTLAVHWAHHVRDEFPDGELFLDLRGYGPGDPMSTEQSLAALLRGLGVPGERIADDVDDRRAMLRSETHGRRMLVVLDNARDAEQVRPLLPGADAFVLVTSRTQLRGLAVREAADRVRVDPMSPAESIALLQRRTGGDVGEAALRELAELCGHLPVALAVAAERIGRVDHDPHPVEAFIAELGDHRSRLGALDSGDDDPLTNVRAVLDWSYRSLDDDSARTFRLLGLYSAPLISTGAVAALIGVEPARTNRPIDRLTDRHLLTPIRDGHYVMHDLVRAFAAQVADEEPEPDRVAATRRLRNWFAHSTARARLAWAPRIAGVHLPDLEPGVAPENFDSPKAGFAWLETNAAYVLRLVAACIEDEDATGHQLAPLLFSYLQSSGMATDSLELFRRAEESARRLGDAVGQAACANSVAGCHFERNEMDEAIGAVERARDLYAVAGDVDGGLRAQSNLAVALYTLDRVDEAIAAFERAIDDARELGARGRLGWNLFNASDVYLSAGRVDDAIHAAEESVDVLGEADSDARALAVDNLGDVQAATGRLADAVETMRTAIEAYRALYMRKDEASALRKLGIFHRDLGERDAARDCWSEALQVLSTIGVAETREVGREELTSLIESLDVPVSDA